MNPFTGAAMLVLILSAHLPRTATALLDNTNHLWIGSAMPSFALPLFDPSEPVLVDVEWAYGQDGEDDDGESSQDVQSRIILVRYNVDGLVVKTTAWEGPSGMTSLGLDRLGEYKLTVTLCDDGGDCIVSDEPVVVTVYDGTGHHRADPSWLKPPPAHLEQSVPVYDEDGEADSDGVAHWNSTQRREATAPHLPGTRRLTSRRLLVGGLLAKEIGKWVLSEVGSYGMNALLDYMFGSGDDLSEKLDDISASLIEVHKQLDTIGKNLVLVCIVHHQPFSPLHACTGSHSLASL